MLSQCLQNFKGIEFSPRSLGVIVPRWYQSRRQKNRGIRRRIFLPFPRATLQIFSRRCPRRNARTETRPSVPEIFPFLPFFQRDNERGVIRREEIATSAPNSFDTDATLEFRHHGRDKNEFWSLAGFYAPWEKKSLDRLLIECHGAISMPPMLALKLGSTILVPCLFFYS